MSLPRCRLSAVGIANALGSDADEVWAGLRAGEPTRISARDDLMADRTLHVGAVDAVLPPVPSELAAFDCRNNALALFALGQIEAEVGRVVEAVGPGRVGVVVGTSTSGVSDAEEAIRHQHNEGGLAPRFDYAQLEFGGVASFVAASLGVRGPTYALSTACSSGARALASARSLLALGVCDAVVAGAVDTLCGLTLHGFSALQAICEGVTNPCSRNRSGLTLGEGAALFLVTREPGGVQLVGVGESSEAHHMSAPDPSGAGAEQAMRAALADAGLAPDAIAYLNLHGTGTPLNDRMEALATERVFGSGLPVSSTKPLVGHTLGAAGAMEAAFCWLQLDRAERGRIALPPHWWDGQRDEELPELHLVAKGEEAACGEVARVMSNSFGFGGNNCALVLERELGAARGAAPDAASPPAPGAPRARVLRWGAWAPGLESREAWGEWARDPRALEPSGHPEARFLPAMLRRRCTPLTRIVLSAAFDCLEESERGEVRTVFASRHGSVNESIGLLEKIVTGQRISPALFSHSVHNAQAGLFCIAAENRRASSSLAGREDSFAMGWLEALAHLEREPERPVLYVMGDVELAPSFAEMVDEPPVSYAVALLLAREGEGLEVGFAADAEESAPERPWPHAAEFLRWLLDEGDAELALRRCRFTRTA